MLRRVESVQVTLRPGLFTSKGPVSLIIGSKTYVTFPKLHRDDFQRFDLQQGHRRNPGCWPSRFAEHRQHLGRRRRMLRRNFQLHSAGRLLLGNRPAVHWQLRLPEAQDTDVAQFVVGATWLRRLGGDGVLGEQLHPRVLGP